MVKLHALVLCVQLVMLGSGGEEYESAMRENERLFPQHFRGWVRHSAAHAHTCT